MSHGAPPRNGSYVHGGACDTCHPPAGEPKTEKTTELWWCEKHGSSADKINSTYGPTCWRYKALLRGYPPMGDCEIVPARLLIGGTE